MSGDGAKRLGEKLLMEVEVEDLSSVFRSLHEFVLRGNGIPNRTQTSHFNISEIDRLILSPGPPILEIISPPPTHHPFGAGKTSLLYLIVAHAILPPAFSSIFLGGQEAAIVLFDPLNHFSVPRLAEIMLSLLCSRLASTDQVVDEPLKAEMKCMIKTALQHLHIFHPQSWSALLATIDSLPDYLFDQTTPHKSMHRRVQSIVLEDIDTFAWSIRGTNTSSVSTSSNALATASAQLTTRLTKLTKLFSCSMVLTSQSTTPSSYRPALPTSWPQGTLVTRLAVRRVDVSKFSSAISIEEAEKEKLQRWEVVSRGRFECWKVGVGVKDGEDFAFRVGKGIEMERGGGG
ncbi:hypothetical protein G6011_08887 [Alternaria panax]|uniref:DNA recombination and repair protein Rad51-like C-terminal domain-containing protein n=1 Tax=Alternaria panax TaxID=48097 RepID=A0AAD4IA29_9PLEO|nr:hypothetical protein G6011_08887 [Alternaria panax]